ncbi:Ig-like domain-containing protein [Sporosalibacterium faouarense]|uniref:Ig-like domain-containing protein n=1 Tax=Sporosalibacterium faouarense TaxID=516123 RepID=UPI00192C53C9|nr:Ig-like domain-containing protein [Sporosalibacterium faouarense]
MKKVLSLVLVISLVLGSFAPVFAAADENDYANQAELLKSLGVLKGDENGNLDLNATLDRQTLMVLTARLMGEEQVAENFKFESPFSDVDHPYFESFISWAYNKGLTNGYGDGTFGPTDLVTVEQLQIFMLRALGYDPQWGVDNIPEMAIEAGIMGDVEAEGNASRGIMAAIVYNTLEADMADGSGTLAASLNVDMPKTAVSVAAVELGTVANGDELDLPETVEVTFDNGTTEELAVDWADYDTTVAGDLTIEGVVEGIELTALATAIVDEADLAVASVTALNLKQIEIVYTTKVDEDSAEDADNYSLAGTYELQEDGITVIGTLDTKVDNQTSKELTIEKILDLNENEIEEVTIEGIDFLDMTIPEVVDAEIVGVDTVKVTFTEPVNVDGLSRSELRKGFSLEKSNGKTVYVSDVTFENNNKVAKVEFYSDFEDGEVYSFTVNNEYKDYAGYTVVKEEFELDVVIDEEAPEVIDFKDAKPYSVTLVFNEDIALEETDEENYYHTNSKNKVEATPTIEENELKLSFNPADKMPSGTVYVYIAKEAVKDLWGNENAQQIRVEIEVEGDTEAPSIVKVEATSQDELKVTFSEEVLGGAETEANYTLLDSDGDEIKSIIRRATITGEDNDQVKLTLRDDISGVHALVIEDVEDIYENAMGEETYEFDVDDVTSPLFADFSATLYGDKEQTLVINFDEAMSTDGEYSVLDLEKYRVEVYEADGSGWSAVREWVSLSDIEDGISISATDDGKKVEIVLDTEDAEYKFAGGDDSLEIARVADAFDNKTVELMDTLDIGSTGTIGVDTFEAVSSTELELTLEGTLDDFAEEDYVIETSGTFDLGEIAIDETINDDGDSVIIFTLLDEELNPEGTVGTDNETITISVNDDSDYEVVSMNDYGEKIVFNNIGLDDAIAPELNPIDDEDGVANDGLVDNGDNTITINFNEEIYAKNDSYAASDLIVEADGEELDAGIDYLLALEDVNQDGSVTEATLTLIGDYTGFDGMITVSTISDVKYIKDMSDNTLAEIDAEEIEVNMVSTVVDAVYGDYDGVTKIVITMDEEIDDVVIDTNAFTVNGVVSNPNVVDVDVNDDEVILTLDGDILDSDAPTLDYDNSVANPMVDLFGNEAKSFSNLTVSPK